MSRVESYIGKLTPVDLEGKTIKEWIKWKTNKIEKPDYFDSWIEFFENQYYKEYYYDHKNSILYKIEKEVKNSEDLVYSKKDNETIDFVVSFYNGGVSFNEIMDEVIENANSDNEK